MSVLLPRPLKCPKCRRDVRQLYPLTDYDPKSGHWRPLEVCLACLGPEGTEADTIASQFKARSVQR